MTAELNFKPDLKRFSQLVDVDQYFRLRDNDVMAMIEVLSDFVVDEEGNYLDHETGRKMIGTVKIVEIGQLFSKLLSDTEIIAVPLASGKASA